MTTEKKTLYKILRQPATAFLLMAAALIVIGLAVYQYALSLPLFWDDIFQFTWLQQVSIAQVLTTRVAGWSTFRPLSFLAWKLLLELQGRFDPYILHFVNVGLHCFNSCLVAYIVTRLTQTRHIVTALVAGLLFLLFPFSFQSITPVNSLMHPLHVCLILLAVCLYLVSNKPGRSVARALSVTAAGVAVLVHENGVLSAAMVSLVALASQPKLSSRRFFIDVVPYWLTVAVFFLIWRSPPGGGNPFSLATIFGNIESRLQNTAYFLQAFAYPVSALAVPLKGLLMINNDLVMILLISVPACAIWVVLAWRGKALRLAALGAAWFALAALPAILMLPFSYVLESPRLLYLASIGAAIFWAAPLAGQWKRGITQRIIIVLLALLLCVTLVWDAVYLQRRASLYTQLGQSIQQLQSSSITPECAAQNTAPTALINYPAWYFVPHAEYLIGHDGITTLSEGQSLDELYRINFGVTRRFAPATLPDIMPAGASFIGMGQARTMDDLPRLYRDSGAVLVNLPSSSGMQLRASGCYAGTQTSVDHTQATFAQAITLVNSNMSIDTQRNELVLTLEWQLLKPLAEDATVFAQALDASGKLIAQTDGYPLGGTAPMRTWRVGELWHDTRYIVMPNAVTSTGARVVVGIYATANGQRLSASDGAGHAIPDNALEITR